MNRNFESAPSEGRDQQNVEEAIDAMIETVIQANARRVNEGNNGVILHVNVEVVPIEQRALLEHNGIPLEGDHAIKALKVFTPEAATREFELQLAAYGIVNEAQAGGREDLARIPRPVRGRDMNIREKTREALKHQGVNVHEDRIGVLLMEYVDGDDLATILYREALRGHVGMSHLREEELELLSFEELQENVWRVFDFSKPGGKSRDAAARQFEQEKVFAENATRLYDYLEKKGFRLHPSIAKQIANTLELLHEQGLVHRDGHPRNFMVVGDYRAPQENEPTSGVAPEVYIVDYGIAKQFPPGSYGKLRSELYTEDMAGVVKRCPPDETILNQIKTLSISREQKQQEITRTLEDTLIKSLPRAEQDTTFVETRAAIIAKGIEVIESSIRIFSSSPAKAELFPVLLFHLEREGHLSPAEMVKIIKTHIDRFPAPTQKTLRELYQRFTQTKGTV